MTAYDQRGKELKRVLVVLALFVICVVQAACTHTPSSTRDDKGLSTLNATLWVEDNNTFDGEIHSSQIVPYFSFIPGSIFGSPIDDVLLPVEVDEEARIVVELSEWAELAETYAAPLTEEYFELGLRIQPKDARLLRVGTFAYDLRHESGMGGGLRELGESGYIVLVYVDRPSVISGSITLDDTKYTHFIDLPAKGFHYVLSDDDGHVSRRDLEDRLLFVTKH